MSREKKLETGVREHWWVMAKSLGFVVGVPFGIGVGAIVGAVCEIADAPHSAALGLVAGLGTAILIGGLGGTWAARTKYKWVQREVPVWDPKWKAVVMALNVEAAKQHYLMVRSDADYVAYAPTLARPVAAGPLTVGTEYLSVVVARLNSTTSTITGPQYMVNFFLEAAELSDPDEIRATDSWRWDWETRMLARLWIGASAAIMITALILFGAGWALLGAVLLVVVGGLGWFWNKRRKPTG